MGVLDDAVTITDIRSESSESSLLDLMQQSLHPVDLSAPSLPTILLYDEKGLKLFEAITHLNEYYFTNVEIDILHRHAKDLAARIPDDCYIVELGSGNLRKIKILLDFLESQEKRAHYYALDLSYPELERTFAELEVASYKYVTFNALHGTYDDGLEWLKSPEAQSHIKCIISLGSSLGNFTRQEAADFLSSFRETLKPADLMIVGLDACQDSRRVHAAYNDSAGVTEQFYRNGLDHANSLLQYPAFKQDEWAVHGTYDEGDQGHHASFVALNDVKIRDKKFRKGDTLHVEDAFKYSKVQQDGLWQRAGLIHQASYASQDGDGHIHVLSTMAN